MILVTGAAGFIGYHVTEHLLAQGEQVLGLDNLNGYYDPALKRARLDRLLQHNSFRFLKMDVSDPELVLPLAGTPGIEAIVHLAAQAGVRYSLENPFAYVQSNVMGQVAMLELARRIDGLKNFVYASSSSVYGGNTKVPFDVADDVEKPQSLYAATKRSDELIAYTYAHLYGLPCTGLRFFTVYGPWGRPATGVPPHAVYNLGNCRPQKLTDFVSVLEDNIGLKASLELAPMQAGDVTHTFADIEASRRDLGFEPVTPIETGLKHFVGWYRGYHAH